jgi:hypothetical protein
MTVEPMVTSSGPVTARGRTDLVHATYAEGIRAGLVGAAAIALWFLIVDTIAGRPFYTPNVLGTALLRGVDAIESPEQLPLSFETVLTFTWIHVLVFLLLGVAAARLVALAEVDAHYGFGIVLLFVIFMFGFLGLCSFIAEPLLRALAWHSVLLGNLIAAVAMAIVFRRRHPRLIIHP